MLPLLKTYLKAILHMMEQLTDSQMLHMLMRHAERLVPYFSTQLRLARKLLKVGLHLWGSSAENRVQSLLLIRRLAVEMPYPFVEACLKGIYLTFKRASRVTTANNRLSIAFMMQARQILQTFILRVGGWVGVAEWPCRAEGVDIQTVFFPCSV
jgi:nucleolar complex protein 2